MTVTYDYVTADNVSPPHVKLVQRVDGEEETVAMIWLGEITLRQAERIAEMATNYLNAAEVQR